MKIDSLENKQLISLLYTCPFCKPLDNCILLTFRKIFESDYYVLFNIIKKEQVHGLINLHQRCFSNRIKTNKSNNRTNNDCNSYLKWTKNGCLDFLTLELKKKNWIKSQRNFAELFDKNESKVYWNFRYKYELAYLFYLLKQKKCICSVNSKGYFKLIERRIIDYSGKEFKENSLKQMSSKINNNINEYIDVINNVKRVIKNISVK